MYIELNLKTRKSEWEREREKENHRDEDKAGENDEHKKSQCKTKVAH